MYILINMRILFAATPAFGHVLPLLPLARAFHARGHHVGFATGPGLAPVVEPEGFELLPAGPMPDVLMAEVAKRTGGDPSGNPTPETVGEFFAGTRLDLGADEALAAAAYFAPDLIVNEMCDFIGPLIATSLGMPLATLVFGPAIPQPMLVGMTAAAAPRYIERGMTPPAVTPSGRWLLDTCPPSLQFEGVTWPTERIALRPEPHQAVVPGVGAPTTGLPAKHGAAEPRPDWTRPRVLVTFGTFFGDPGVVGPLLKELSGLNVGLSSTLGLDGKAEDYDLDPQRVELVPFVPMSQLLDGVSAVVTHGGAGTTLGALARGIPLVVIPQGADQFVQADRVVAAGAGLALPPDHYSPHTAAWLLSRVLTEPGFTANARRIRDEIAAMSSPDEVAGRLEAALAE
jgi:UDP:flavonoid glycosyltransferase YjiC (YdhE family)